MSSFIPYQQTISICLSFAGLAFSLFTSCFSRTYSKLLEASQMFYLFTFTIAIKDSFFSLQLGRTWLNFIPSMLNYCSTGSLQCDSGNLITAQIIWAALVLFLLIITKLVGIKKPNATFKPVYNFIKGALKWMQIPLIYRATVVFINQLQLKQYNRELFVSAVILAFYVLVYFIQVIYYKRIQSETQDVGIKWVQFFGHLRLSSMAALMAGFTKISQNGKYILYASIIIYDIIHLAKYNFSYKICQRVCYFLMEASFISVYSLFIFGPSYIYTYNLDLFALAIIAFIEFFLIFIKMHYYCKHGQSSGAVNPETDEKEKNTRKVDTKKNDNHLPPLDLSYQQLNNSSSPRNNKRR